MRNKLKIAFTRDSVCMEDDMEEHILEKEFDIKDAWDKHCIWHDRWIEEYRLCGVMAEYEKEWK